VLRLEHADWRRMVMASAITLVALPSLWLMNRNDDSGAPNLAAAGVAVGADHATAGSPDVTPPPAIGSSSGAFMESPSDVLATDIPDGDDRIAIAVPAPKPGTSSFGRATFRSTFPDPATCIVKGAPYAATVTITNLDNGRTTSCTASVSPVGSPDAVVLHTAAFVQIADLTDSPVPVELNW
jgi:hypothetical protein